MKKMLVAVGALLITSPLLFAGDKKDAQVKESLKKDIPKNTPKDTIPKWRDEAVTQYNFEKTLL